MKSGSGKIVINQRELDDYFGTKLQGQTVRQPLLATEALGKFDILILVHGGGLSGQADAARLGIARALEKFNSELRPTVKALGYLSRDPRKHERKKYGRPGARKRFQYSKR
jgi:small subunit ribosomal protein S9